MTPDRTDWGDSRLSDAFTSLGERLGEVIDEVRALRSLPTAIAELSILADQHHKDVDACHAAVRDLRTEVHEYIEEQAEVAEQRRKEEAEVTERRRVERKSDRRWLVTTMLASAMIVIAAVGLLWGHLG